MDCPADYFDGHQAVARPVRLRVVQGVLHIDGEGVDLRVPVQQVAWPEVQRHGMRLAYLPVVSGGKPAAAPERPAAEPSRQSSQPAQTPASAASSPADGDIVGQIERLGRLRDQGVLSPEEFAAAKAGLLKRL